MKKFEDFHLHKNTMKFIALNHFKAPTPIQEEVIPAMLRKKDVIGLSKTGTGKTHAYLIPLMELCDSSSSDVQAVITAPTRELAVQIFEKAKVIQEADPGQEAAETGASGGKARKRKAQEQLCSEPEPL